MFKVPSDPDNPSYDDTFTVSFWRWLTSSKADRGEWRRRKNAAIHTSSSVRFTRNQAEHAAEKRDEIRARKNAKRAAKRVRKTH